MNSSNNVVCAIFVLLASMGCQTNQVISGRTVPAAAHSTMFDSCGDRMEDLCGPLIYFYRQNGRGPERLEELQPFAIPGQQIENSCPVSGKPYLCAPDGLSADGQDIRIYVFDAEPAHDGRRWCAVKKNGTNVNQPAIMYAVSLPEADFRRFRLVPVQLPIQ